MSSMLRVVAASAIALSVSIADPLVAQTWGQYGVAVHWLPTTFTLGGSAQSVNNFGQVAGASPIGTLYNASIFDVRTNTLTTGLFGPTYSFAGAINNSGGVTGNFVSPVDGTSHAAFNIGSGVVDLGGLGPLVAAGNTINDAGDVAGSGNTTDGSVQSFAYKGGVLSYPDPTAEYALIVSMNNLGVMVGGSGDDGGITAPVMYDAAGRHDLGSFGGDYGFASDINDAGNVVGASFTSGDATFDAFFSDALGMHDIGAGAFYSSYASAIDASSRYIVGLGLDAAANAFGAIWEDNAGSYVPYLITDIVNAESNSGVTFSTFNVDAISDNAQYMVGHGCGVDRSGAQVCGPVVLESLAPEPSTVVLMASGLLGLAGVARRRRRSPRQSH